MKHKLIYLLIPGLLSCQREFPEPEIPEDHRSVKLVEKWKSGYPAEEEFCWVETTANNDVLYLNQVENTEAAFHLYRFDPAGNALDDFKVEAIMNDFNPASAQYRLVGDWLHIHSYNYHLFVHIINRQIRYSREAVEIPSNHPKDLFLYKRGICYYQDVSQKGVSVLYEWSLDNDQRTAIDTFITKGPQYYYLVGELDVSVTRVNFNNNLLFLKEKSGLETRAITHGLYGLMYDNSSTYRWNLEEMFKYENYIMEWRSLNDEDMMYLVGENQIWGMDMLYQRLLWNRSPGGKIYDLKISSGLLLVPGGYTLYAFDPRTGASKWTAYNDGFRKKMAANEQFAALVNFRNINPNELLGAQLPNLDIYDVRNGTLLYSKADILESGSKITDDPDFGLQHPIAMSSNRLFVADHQQFGAFDVLVE